jgi:hypothetical protein
MESLDPCDVGSRTSSWAVASLWAVGNRPAAPRCWQPCAYRSQGRCTQPMQPAATPAARAAAGSPAPSKPLREVATRRPPTHRCPAMASCRCARPLARRVRAPPKLCKNRRSRTGGSFANRRGGRRSISGRRIAPFVSRALRAQHCCSNLLPIAGNPTDATSPGQVRPPHRRSQRSAAV